MTTAHSSVMVRGGESGTGDALRWAPILHFWRRIPSDELVDAHAVSLVARRHGGVEYAALSVAALGGRILSAVG